MRTRIYSYLLLLAPLCGRAQQRLELNLQKGASYSHTVSTVSKIHQEIADNAVDLSTTVGAKTVYTVTSVRDSSYGMEVRYKNMSMKMEGGGMDMSFSSDSSKQDMMSKLLSSFINASFWIDVSKRGNITEVTGIDSIVRKMLDRPELAGMDKKTLEEQFMKTYGTESFKGNFDMFMFIYPPSGKINKAEKWTVPLHIGGGGIDAVVTMVYELVSENGDEYTIHGEGKLSTPEDSPTMNQSGVEMKFKLSGRMTSDFKIAKQTGWIRSGRVEQAMDGGIELKKSAMLPEAVTIPVNINNTTEVTGQ